MTIPALIVLALAAANALYWVWRLHRWPNKSRTETRLFWVAVVLVAVSVTAAATAAAGGAK